MFDGGVCAVGAIEVEEADRREWWLGDEPGGGAVVGLCGVDQERVAEVYVTGLAGGERQWAI